MEIGYCLDGSSHKQSSAVLVRYGKALSPAIADCLGCQTDQQLTRMGIGYKQYDGWFADLDVALVPSRVDVYWSYC